MPDKPIAIIGSIDATRRDYEVPLENAELAPDAGRALGKALAEAGYPILVFSSSPRFLENFVVKGYVDSRKAQEKSIRMVYPLKQDPNIHGTFAEQKTFHQLFDPKLDTHPRWEASYYQCLPDVEGVLMLGGGNATLIIGLMALASQAPIVSLATFGGTSKEIWPMLREKPWIDSEDHQQMGQTGWTDTRASLLVASFAHQRKNLQSIEDEKRDAVEKQRLDRDQRVRVVMALGLIAAVLTAIGFIVSPGLFGNELRLLTYGICFTFIPITAGMSGAALHTLRRTAPKPPPLGEALVHGLWAGVGSAFLFFLSQVTSNRDFLNLSKSLTEPEGASGLNTLLVFSLMVAFIAGLTYEAVFGKWEAVDVSQTGVLKSSADD